MRKGGGKGIKWCGMRVARASCPLLSTLTKPKYFAGNYQVLGRDVHLSYVKEQLEDEQKHNFDFSAKRKTEPLVTRVEILSETLYIQVSHNKLELYADHLSEDIST